MTDQEFNDFIESTTVALKDITKKAEILEILCTSIKQFIPSNEIRFFSIYSQSNRAISIEAVESNIITFPLDKEGIISQCYEFKQPLIVNDLKRSLLYNKDVDNLGMTHIEEILVVPVIENREPKNVIGIIWVGIDKGYQQFIQQDIENLVRFSNITKDKLFFGSNNIEDNSLAACRVYRRELQTKLERLENSFASTIHDIRTPMNAVIGFMELMMLTEKDTQKRDYIDATLKSGEHIVAMINDALDMSKVSNGKMSLNKNDFSPLEGLSDIAKLFYNSMKKKGINFDIYLDPHMPATLHSDLHRVKQIVNNLLSNALKFTPEDGRVTLNAQYDKNDNLLKISVMDTGIGIAKEKQKDIFSPYKQESSATSSEYGGTGLGLAISQQLSILLDGRLTLESEKGEGCKFVFVLPCDQADSEATDFHIEKLKESKIVMHKLPNSEEMQLIENYFNDLQVPYKLISNLEEFIIPQDTSLLIMSRDVATDKADEIQEFLGKGGALLFVEENFDSKHCRFEGNLKILPKPILPNMLFDSLNGLVDPSMKDTSAEEDMFGDVDRFKGYSTLVVDDSMINLKLMVEVLKRFNLDVVSSINPKEALKVLESRLFDIIFIDQNMPIMNGDEMIKKIREDEKSKNLKPATIYALTGTTDEATREKMLEAGANAVYAKPMHIEDIYKAIVKTII